MHDDAGRVGAGLREVGRDCGVALGGVAAGGGVDVPAEPGGDEAECEHGQDPERSDADHEREDRPADEAGGDAAPDPVGGLPRRGPARPEDGAAEDGEQRRQQRQAGQQHGGDADGQGHPEVVVEPEARGQQGEQGHDHGRRRGGDRLTHPLQRVHHGLVGLAAGVELLSDAEDEEEPVVGAGAEDEDDQQDLGEERNLQHRANAAEGADEGAGEQQDQRGRQQGHEWRQRRPEDQEEQDDDEEDGRVLDLLALRGGLLVGGGIGGQLSGQVGLEPLRQAGAFEDGVHVVDECVALPLVEGCGRRHEQELGCLVVRGGAQVLDGQRRGHVAQVGEKHVDGRLVAGAQRASVGDRDHGDGAVGDGTDQRLCERGGQVAGCALGEERAVVVVDLAGQGRQRGHRRNRAGEPHRDDEVAVPDHERAERAVEVLTGGLSVAESVLVVSGGEGEGCSCRGARRARSSSTGREDRARARCYRGVPMDGPMAPMKPFAGCRRLPCSR